MPTFSTQNIISDSASKSIIRFSHRCTGTINPFQLTANIDAESLSGYIQAVENVDYNRILRVQTPDITPVSNFQNLSSGTTVFVFWDGQLVGTIKLKRYLFDALDDVYIAELYADSSTMSLSTYETYAFSGSVQLSITNPQSAGNTIDTTGTLYGPFLYPINWSGQSVNQDLYTDTITVTGERLSIFPSRIFWSIPENSPKSIGMYLNGNTGSTFSVLNLSKTGYFNFNETGFIPTINNFTGPNRTNNDIFLANTTTLNTGDCVSILLEVNKKTGYRLSST